MQDENSTINEHMFIKMYSFNISELRTQYRAKIKKHSTPSSIHQQFHHSIPSFNSCFSI